MKRKDEDDQIITYDRFENIQTECYTDPITVFWAYREVVDKKLLFKEKLAKPITHQRMLYMDTTAANGHDAWLITIAIQLGLVKKLWQSESNMGTNVTAELNTDLVYKVTCEKQTISWCYESTDSLNMLGTIETLYSEWGNPFGYDIPQLPYDIDITPYETWSQNY